MRGVITVKKKVLTGAFTVIFTFPRQVEFTSENILIKTIEGDSIGCEKDCLSGGGKNYILVCYVQDGLRGKSRISVKGFAVDPVDIEYDTIDHITAIWGTPIVKRKQIEIPVTLSESVGNLRKVHFHTTANVRVFLYGADNEYKLVLKTPRPNLDFEVFISGKVKKLNDVEVLIKGSLMEVKT